MRDGSMDSNVKEFVSNIGKGLKARNNNPECLCCTKSTN